VIGAGGLGAPALLYLAASGVGKIGVVDDDLVENSNLQRQVIHRHCDIGAPKAQSARRAMAAINPDIEVEPIKARLDEALARDLFPRFDLVLDGTDNFATRYMVNRIAAEHGTPLIAAAISQWEGQISLYDPARGTPCFQCIFPEAPAIRLQEGC